MRQPAIPQPALTAAIAAAVSLFALLLGAVAVAGADVPAIVLLPVVFVPALWLFPATGAALRGERWVFILLLALTVFVTAGNFRARVWSDKSLDWQVALKGSVWLAGGILGLMHFAAVRRSLARPPGLFAGALVLLMIASAAWSPVWSYTLTAGVSYVFFLLFGLAAAGAAEEDDLLFGLAAGFAAVVVLSLMVAPFGNSLAGFSPGSTASLENRLAGITDHPIGLAEACGLSIFLSGMMLARRRGKAWIWWLVIGAAAVDLALSRSRMPALAVAAAWAVVYSHRRGLLPQFLLAAAAGGTAAGLVIFGFGLERLLPDDLLSLFSRSGEAKEVLTLSGRLAIWKVVLAKVSQAPLLGHGFASGIEVLHDFRRWHLNHSHNGYLQSLLYLGLCGLVLFLAVIWGQLKAFLRAPSLGRDCFVFYALFLSLTEQGPIPNTPGITTLLWFIAVGMCARRDALRAEAPMVAPVGVTPVGVTPVGGSCLRPAGNGAGKAPG